MAQSRKRVVLIDGDMRRPSILNSVQLPKPEAGLVELLSGDATLEQCLVKDPRSNVYLLPSAKVAGNPPDLMASNAMENLISSLKVSFDAVIIDSAPLLPVNDTRILAQLVDAVVFVIRWERTPRNAVANAARTLSDIKAKVAGAVIARADSDRYRYYSYGYQSYYSYNKYYSD
jgi:capsular exopolysaccharide synthesis family protein